MRTKKPASTPSRTSRRRFTKSVAATIVAAPLAAGLARAQKSGGAKEPTAPPNPQPVAPAQKPSPLAEAYAEIARARYGKQWTPDEFEQVKKDFEDNLRAAERLRAAKLSNEDEPDFMFSVD